MTFLASEKFEGDVIFNWEIELVFVKGEEIFKNKRQKYGEE